MTRSWAPRLRGWRSLVLLVLVLAGCGALPAETPEASAARIVVLWHPFRGTEAKALQALTDRFNATDDAVVLVAEYQEDIVDKLASASSEHHPDLVVVWPKDVQAYRAHGLITGPATYASELRRAYSDLLPMAAALYTVEGELLALPLGLSTHLLYYNVDWLADLGYDAETAGWENLRSAACAATDPTGGQVGVGFPAESGVLLALLASGRSQVTVAGERYNFADDAGLATANTLHSILNGGCGAIYDDREAGLARLSNSAMAMTVASSLEMRDIERAVEAGRNFELGMSALPGGGDGPTGPTLWYGPGMAIVAPQGARREVAARVLGWFFSAEAQAQWQTTTDYLPVRRSLLTSVEAEAVDEEEAPGLDRRLAQITLQAADSDDWVAWPRYTNVMACRSALLRVLLVLRGETPPDAALATAVTACNAGVRSGEGP